MAFKLLSLNSLMGRRKPEDSAGESAVVNAAAWAWCQRGSGSKEKAMSEFDVTRTHNAARPSRYKLEAMRMAKEGSPIRTKNKKSLLDTYEVQSISRQLDSLIGCSHNNNNRVGNGDNSANGGLENGGRIRVKKERRRRKGFWPRHAAVCGRGEAEVDGSALRDGRLST